MLGQGGVAATSNVQEPAPDTTIDTAALDHRPAGGLNRAVMRRALLVLAVVLAYVLHQDVWLWRSARPLVFGFLPVGLFYHACYTVAVSGLMWLLVRYAWPAHLEDAASGDGETPPR
jgi:hypothetical protein